MAQTSPSTPLTWCDECCKFTTMHLLVHHIEAHAPRIGDRRRTGQWNWRTAVLQEAS